MENIYRKQHQHKFSIIVPVLNEQRRINSFLEKVNRQGYDSNLEIIIVDGDSHGGTINAVRDNTVICLTSPKGRGRQMNNGAAKARGEILIFLHADTKLPDNALGKISKSLQDTDYVGGAFDLKIDSDRLFLKYISVRTSLRSRWSRIPYGDQAIFIRKKYFEQIGGFKEIPLMEDVELMRRIKKDGKKIIIVPDKVTTSARRWENDGALFTTVRNRILVGLYYLGVSPHKLAKYYWRKS